MALRSGIVRHGSVNAEGRSRPTTPGSSAAPARGECAQRICLTSRHSLFTFFPVGFLSHKPEQERLFGFPGRHKSGRAARLEKRENRKMEKTNIEQAAITIRYNEESDGGRCVFCGEPVASNGFDFMTDGKMVCHSCAAEKSPDLFRVFEDARTWMEESVTFNYESGIKDGRRNAAEAIFEAVIQDDPNAKVIRACLLEFEKAGPEPDVDEI